MSASARLRLLQDLDSRGVPWGLLCAQEVLPELRDQIAGTFPGATVAYFIDHLRLLCRLVVERRG